MIFLNNRLKRGFKPTTNFLTRAGMVIFAAALVAQPFGGAVFALQTLGYTEKPFTTSELANWSKDRKTPTGGYDSVSFGGRNDVLEMRLDKDKQDSGAFYQTEGLQHSVPASDSVRADVYVDSAWSGKTVRAGLWGVGYDSANAVASYPIIEYTTDGFTGWRYWNVNQWVNLPGVTAATGTWSTLAITHDAANHEFDLSVNGTEVASVTDEGSDHIGAAILNSKNYGTASYEAHWSNFAYGSYHFVAETPTNAKFSNPAVCGGSTNQMSTVASWSQVTDATSYNYKAWKTGHATYGTFDTAYTTHVTSTSQPGAFNIGEGTYYFAVQTVYADGQTSGWTTPCAATYDTTAPAAVTLKSPANKAYVKGTSLTQSWNASSSSDVDHYVYESFNDSAATSLRWQQNVSGTSKTATNVGNSTFWWHVKAVDKAGNSSSWSPLWKLTVDSTAPVGDITSPANNSTVVAVGGKIVVNGTVTDNSMMNRVGVQLVKPGVSGHIQYLYDHMVNTNPGTWQVEFDAASLHLANGTYGLNLYFTDMAGNTSVKKTTFTLANPVPVVAAQDFGVGSWQILTDGFQGINVGFEAKDFTTVDSITVDLYNADGKLVANTASTDFLDLINANGWTSLSSPFVVSGSLKDTYCGGNACWVAGKHDWIGAKKPTKAVITVTGTNNYGESVTETATNENFTEDASSFASILPTPAQEITAPVVAGVTTHSPQPRSNPSLNSGSDDQTNGEQPEVLGASTLATTTPVEESSDNAADNSSDSQTTPANYDWVWWAAPVGAIALGGAAWWLLARRRGGE